MGKIYDGKYDWQCPKCGAWQNTDTTGDMPDLGDELECIRCKKKSEVVYAWVRYNLK